MSLGLVLCIFVFMLFLSLRFQLSRNRPPQPSTPQQRFKLVKILIAALLALLAINMRLSKLNDNLDGKQAKEPTFFERILDRH